MNFYVMTEKKSKSERKYFIKQKKQDNKISPHMFKKKTRQDT